MFEVVGRSGLGFRSDLNGFNLLVAALKPTSKNIQTSLVIDVFRNFGVGFKKRKKNMSWHHPALIFCRSTMLGPSHYGSPSKVGLHWGVAATQLIGAVEVVRLVARPRRKGENAACLKVLLLLLLLLLLLALLMIGFEGSRSFSSIQEQDFSQFQ